MTEKIVLLPCQKIGKEECDAQSATLQVSKSGQHIMIMKA